MTPAPFSHPLLITQKVIPQQPVADEAPQVDAPLGVKSDKGADATKEIGKATDTAEVKLELRSTVGHALTQTADASNAMPANAAVTMSDASPAAASGEATPVKVEAANVEETKTGEAKSEEAKSEEAKPEGAKSETAKSDAAPCQGSGNDCYRRQVRRDRDRRDHGQPCHRNRDGRRKGCRAEG